MIPIFYPVEISVRMVYTIYTEEGANQRPVLYAVPTPPPPSKTAGRGW